MQNIIRSKSFGKCVLIVYLICVVPFQNSKTDLTAPSTVANLRAVCISDLNLMERKTEKTSVEYRSEIANYHRDCQICENHIKSIFYDRARSIISPTSLNAMQHKMGKQHSKLMMTVYKSFRKNKNIYRKFQTFFGFVKMLQVITLSFCWAYF